MTTTAQACRSDEVVFASVMATGVIMAALTALAYYFGDWIIASFTSPEFVQYHDVFWVLVLALSLFNLAQLLSFRGFSSRQTGLYIWPKGIQALLFVALSLLLVGRYGISGVATALAVSSFGYLVLVVNQNRHVKVQDA
jgi:O-antigen/teichoic acid export membrane protein